MKREGYKKTAIRMPEYLWNELTEVAYKYGVSNNSMMVLWIGQMLEMERKKNDILKPENMGKMLNEINENKLAYLRSVNDDQK